MAQDSLFFLTETFVTELLRCMWQFPILVKKKKKALLEQKVIEQSKHTLK